MSAATCPNVKRHTKHPTGYLGHADWAEKKMRTHVQERCPGCGLWKIWKPKRKRAASVPGQPPGEADKT